MLYYYNSVKVHYVFYGKPSTQPIIFLHGWGRSGGDIEKNAGRLGESVLSIDFPPFGKSDIEPHGWSIFSYVQMLMSLCEHLKISSCDIIGHSFGGRVAIIFAAVNCTNVHSCILVDAAGMKPRRSVKYRLKIAKYKFRKKMGLSVDGYGSSDYQKLSPAMRQVFVDVVGTHLEDYARKIVAPTLIVWGKRDMETPIYMARRLKRLIKNSRLEILQDGGHFSFLDCPLEFCGVVKDFLGGIL